MAGNQRGSAVRNDHQNGLVEAATLAVEPDSSPKASFLQKWLRQPQRTWLRKAVFQIHLWMGLLLGIYIVVVCASGSALVFRNDIYDILQTKILVTPAGHMLNRADLAQVLERSHPGYTLRSVRRGRSDDEATEVTLAPTGDAGFRRYMGLSTETRRLVNPYTGADIGPAVSHWYRLMNWMGELHGKLLLGSDGMIYNAIGGLLLVFVCLSGMIVWWPGMGRVARAIWVRRGTGWKRLNYDLHTAVGFWLFALLFIWGYTGWYFVFPDSTRSVINYFTPIFPPPLPQAAVQAQPAPAAGSTAPAFPPRRRRRPLTFGGKILRDFSYAHYGNFAGWPVKALYTALGMLPLVLFVTALIMWWNRVLAPALRRRLAGRAAESASLPSL